MGLFGGKLQLKFQHSLIIRITKKKKRYFLAKTLSTTNFSHKSGYSNSTNIKGLCTKASRTDRQVKWKTMAVTKLHALNLSQINRESLAK